jgi:flagellar FliL protein
MSNKLIFLVVAVLLVITLGLAGGFFMMWNKLSALNTHGNALVQDQQDQGATLGTIFPLDTFIVNLADEERSRYLRVTINLELLEAVDAEKLNRRLPQVRDSILMILPSKRLTDIASIEGKTALRDEIISKLNGLFPKSVISNIFFSEFVVQ